MEYINIPAIVILCYLVGEIFKLLILKKEENYKYIPIIVGTTGGLIGLLVYFLYPEMLPGGDNPIVAISIGIISGLASTGSDQLIRQLIKNKKEE
jgi:hypothetical protein